MTQTFGELLTARPTLFGRCCRVLAIPGSPNKVQARSTVRRVWAAPAGILPPRQGLHAPPCEASRLGVERGSRRSSKTIERHSDYER